MKKVQIINNTQLAITKNNALPGLIMPAGISLIAVRGFTASYFASSQRLKAMAAERANIIQRITNRNLNTIIRHVIKFVTSFPQPMVLFKLDCPVYNPAEDFNPKKKPINAKGIAKIV